jgi:hypothetical protein
MDKRVDVASFLSARRDALIAEAQVGVGRAHLAHYEAAGSERVGERLGSLTDLVIDCCREHRVDEVAAYADGLASDRHSDGYPLLEVQTVINVLEETLWGVVMTELPTEDQGYALGLVSTVLGAIKDELARGYLAQSGSHPVPLRVESLFSGSEGSPRLQ